jgi:hypothetical protein
VREAKIIEQNAKWLDADRSLPDVLMAVEFGSAGGLGVVAMNYLYIIQADGGVEVLQGLINALFADDIVSGNVSVAGIDAGGDRNDATEAVDDFGNLLEAASKGEFGAGSVLDQDREPGLREVEIFGGGSDGGGGLQQAGFAIASTKGTGVEDKIIGADGEGTLDFTAESFDGFSEEQFIGTGKIHQVVGVDDEGFQIVLRAQLHHLLAEGVAEFVGRPLAWAGREYLKRVASDAIGALGGVVNASGGGSVNANATGSQAGRAFWRSTSENILFAGEGPGHEASIKGSLREPDGRVVRHHTVFSCPVMARAARLLRLRCRSGRR